MDVRNQHVNVGSCLIGGTGIVVDRLVGESIMVEWAAIPFGLALLLIVLMVRSRRQT
jgi:hypothetical protein